MKMRFAFLIIVSLVLFGCAANQQTLQAAPNPSVSIEKFEDSSLTAHKQETESVNKNLVSDFQNLEEKTLAEKVQEEESMKTELPPIPAQTDTNQTEAQIPEEKLVSAPTLNPFAEIQQSANAAFLKADSLIQAGKNDSAVVLLDQLLVLKPLWNSWMERAEAMRNKATDSMQQHSESFASLTAQILNENRARGDFLTIQLLADSLRSLNPGDSLLAFAQKQEEIAFAKTLKRAKAEMEKIQKTALESGNFMQADSAAYRLILKYRYLSDTLHLNTWKNDLQNLSNAQKLNKNYWQTHSTEEAFQKAAAYAAAGNYRQAKEILILLQSSNAYQRAVETLKTLAETSCEQSRKKASNLYVKALAVKPTTEKKKEQRQNLLQQAKETLHVCLDNFPESEEAKKAQNDLKLLADEEN